MREKIKTKQRGKKSNQGTATRKLNETRWKQESWKGKKKKKESEKMCDEGGQME